MFMLHSDTCMKLLSATKDYWELITYRFVSVPLSPTPLFAIDQFVDQISAINILFSCMLMCNSY